MNARSAEGTWGRLSFWVPPGREEDLDAVFDRHLAPLLQKHGLVDPAPDQRLSVAGVCRRIFALERAADLVPRVRALARDAAWQAVLEQLKKKLGLVRHALEPYAAPAGVGKVFEVGAGVRQGMWQSFGIPDGMPSCISAMLQDRNGDLWLGTGWHKEGREWGVYRYDGARLYCLTTADGLVNNRIRALLEDSQGRLWLGAYGGICCYDGDRFECYTTADGLSSDAVFSLLEDGQGRIWVGSMEGLDCWDGQRFHGYSEADGLVGAYHMSDGLPYIGVSSLLEDRQGQVWAGTWGGLSRFDGEGFTTYTAKDGLANDWVRDLAEDGQGRIWAATGRWDSGTKNNEPKGGLSCFDGGGLQTYTERDGLPHAMVRCVLADRQGKIWAGTWGGGVSRFDGEGFRTYTSEDGLANNTVFSLLEDDIGYLWVGTLGGGLSRCDRVQVARFGVEDGLPNNGVTGLMEDGEGRLWAATREGVCRFDGRRFVLFEAGAGRIVTAMALDRRGRLWLGTNGEGILRCSDGEVRAYTILEGRLQCEVRAIVEDREGVLWAATNQGICRCDGDTWVHIGALDGLIEDEPRALLEDAEGRLWIASDNGVGRRDGQKLTVYRVEEGLSHDSVLSLCQDRAGRLWLGTDGGGVCCWDGRGFVRYGVEEGLCHDQVTAILEDRQGDLWFGTFGGGVSRFDGRVFQTFSRQDGLAHDTVLGLYEDREGAVWIATEDGLTRYRPQRQPPRVGLGAITADRRYGPEEAVRIPASQQVLLFSFWGRSWTTAAGRMAYVYRLRGHDADWRPAYRGRAEYQALPEGDYCFEVKAVDRDLNYSEAASTRLSVEPDLRLEGWKEAFASGGGAAEFIGASAAIKEVQIELSQVAPTDMTVLILGETGTGKGLAARALHALSQGRGGPFVHVTCGGLPPGLVESELFGHEKGAFTGAARRKAGKVEYASGGTLFLDEIGDLPPEAQAKLLRLLEERTFERVGGTQTLTVDARVVAATNRDLQQMVADGTFREDLYYRLDGFIVRLPALRQRRQDIALLASYFMETWATHVDKDVSQLSPEALSALEAYQWPGNVRELEHTIRRAVIVASGPTIQTADLSLETGAWAPDEVSTALTPEEYERQYMLRLLEEAAWVIRGPEGAAAMWGVPEGTFRSRMKKHGIVRPKG